jgi:hypothetical protein
MVKLIKTLLSFFKTSTPRVKPKGYIEISYSDYWKIFTFEIPALVKSSDGFKRIKSVDGVILTSQPNEAENDETHNEFDSIVEYYLENKSKFLNQKANNFEFKKQYNSEYYTGTFKEINIPIKERIRIVTEYNKKYKNHETTTTNICPYCNCKLHLIPKARCKCKECGKFIRVKYDPDVGETYQMTVEQADKIDTKYQKTYDVLNSVMGQSFEL